jgi:hypothetical protein
VKYNASGKHVRFVPPPANSPAVRRDWVSRRDRGTDAPAGLMEIESAQLTTCDVTGDGEAIRLRFVDTAGNPVALKLPFAQAGSLAMTLPHLLTKALRARHGNEGSRFVFPLGEWILEGVADGRTVIMTLKTTDGFEVSFAAPIDHCRSLASDLKREAAEVAAAAPRTN